MNRVARFFWALLGTAAMQKGPLWWSGNHIDHHRFTDREGDPHSPRLVGFYRAHIGWFLDGEEFATVAEDNPVVRKFGQYPKLRWLGLKSLVQEVLDILDEQAESKSIVINNTICDSIAGYADKMTVTTVLRNLLSNALKFTHPEGEITIEASVVDQDSVKVRVSDNGVGISEERLSHLFDPERQNTTRGTGNEPGTGLGLALCKEFVEKNGGELTLQSRLGQGTTFWFTLPRNGSTASS